jgi:hypothetical protein
MGAAVAGQPRLFHHSKSHNRCNCRANNLTLILGTEGNVFGSFTPVKCESRKWDEIWKYKNDSNGQSFLFALRNLPSLLSRKSALKSEKKH